MAIPALTGFAPSVTLLENTVNATPQLLDADVTFTDPDNNFTSGTLVVSGLLAQDSVSISNQGAGAGQIGFDSGTGVVSFGGIAIGTATGGAGGTLTITFNAAATSPAIEALIENLTYGNSSDTPTASRALTIEVTDAAGAGTRGTALSFAAPNPLAGIDVSFDSTPTLGDLDGDGDLDIVVGNNYGHLFTITNTGTAAAPVFGAPVQIGTIVGFQSTPTLGDLDGDGDLDIVAGNFSGLLFTIANTGTAAAPAFAAPVQIAGIDVGFHPAPTLGDLDGDGDLDIVVGERYGFLFTITNTGTAAAPVFAAPVQIAGIDVGLDSAPTLGDLDGDGDLDIVAGNSFGLLFTITNTGTAAAPVFAAPVQIAGIDLGEFSAPTLGDLDGDGDLDIVSGESRGGLVTILGSSDPQIVIHVTAQNDAPSGLSKALTTLEDAARVLAAGDFGFSDVDGNTLAGVRIMTLPAAGTLTNNGVAVSAGQLISIADIDAGYLAFQAALDANGAAYAAFTFQVQDNGGTVGGGVDLDPSPNTLTINVTPVEDAPTAVTFSNVRGSISENTSTAAPIKVADITVIDADGGNNVLSLAGTDGARFQIIGGDLWLKAGAKLDFETNPLLDVTVNVNGIGVGVGIDASGSLAIAVTDVIDTINGTNAADALVGASGVEIISGFGGNDRIWGFGGDDRILGGLGADIMRGGDGRDVFVYLSTSHSAPGRSGLLPNGTFSPGLDKGLRDIIGDFTHLVDKFDFSAIDANAGAAGNQAFVWKGAGDFTAAGQLIARQFNFAGTAGDKTIVYGDINGDAKADFQIELSGLKTLGAGDFVL